MLPFAAALAIAALGQTLVVMQGGIDLSIAGGLSLYVVILTHYPNGVNSRLFPAIGIAFLAAIAAGSVNGFLIGRMRLNPIVATLGTNALLYGAVFWYTGGIPRTTTARLARLGGGVLLGIPIPIYFAVVTTAVVTAVVKLTPVGRRFEGVGANLIAARTAGIRVQRHGAGAYVWAQILYCLAALLHAGIVNQPTSHEGDNYLLPSVAAVVLGGTSLLGGRGNLVATAIASSLPLAARPVRPRARRDVRHAPARPGGSARSRRGALHRQLESAHSAPRAPSPGERRTHLTGSSHGAPITENGRENTHDPTTRRSDSRVSAPRWCGAGHGGHVVCQDDRAAVLVRPEEDHARLDGWVRRQQLASRDDGFGAGRSEQVPERDVAHLRRRPGQHAEGDLGHPGHGRQGRQGARRLPGRRKGDPACSDAARTRRES